MPTLLNLKPDVYKNPSSRPLNVFRILLWATLICLFQIHKVMKMVFNPNVKWRHMSTCVQVGVQQPHFHMLIATCWHLKMTLGRFKHWQDAESMQATTLPTPYPTHSPMFCLWTGVEGGKIYEKCVRSVSVCECVCVCVKFGAFWLPDFRCANL